MKKIVIAALLTMSIALVGCSKEEVKVEDKPAVEDTVTDSNVNESEDANTEENQDGAVNEDAATEDTTEDANVNEEKQKELDEIRNTVAGAYEDYVPSMPYEKEQITDIFGVDASWYDAVVAEGPMMSAHVDTFLAFHATEGNQENIKTALETYKEYLINDSFQYPMNMDKVKAATILEDGENIYFIMLGLIDDSIVDEGERLKAFEEENKIAVEAIKAYK